MKNKKYLPAAIIMYLNYFVHGVGCSVLGQATIKATLANAWGVEAMKITAISAALGLGRLIALPFAGPLSDKMGRKISTMVGSLSYAVYLLGLMFAFNAGTNGGYTIAYVCAVIGGIANSFLDTGIYPALGEIFTEAKGVATMGIKFAISVSQMFLAGFLGFCAAPIIVDGVQATFDLNGTAVALNNYNKLFIICGLAYAVLGVLIFFCKLPDGEVATEKKEGLIEGIKKANFTIESIAMIAIGFTCTGTFQLWLNCAQNYAVANAGWENPAIMQTYYSMACLAVLVGTAFLTKWIKDVRFIFVYPVICLATLIMVRLVPTQATLSIGAALIGGFASGGLLQIATAVCNTIFPQIKGTVTALVMIMSSLCNYTLLQMASGMTPAGVMTMNIVLTAVGVLLGLFVNLRYAKLVASAE
ncbi:MAG: MFS transporter [Bacillota bacterium]|nr:MFS transporter [Bacillota bacterium]